MQDRVATEMLDIVVGPDASAPVGHYPVDHVRLDNEPDDARWSTWPLLGIWLSTRARNSSARTVSALALKACLIAVRLADRA